MIVITTTVPLNYWYGSYKTNSNDTLSQLYRRIGCYVMITEDEITVYEEIGNDGRPKGKEKFYKNELVKKAREERKNTNFTSFFGKICEESEVKLNEINQMEMVLPF